MKSYGFSPQGRGLASLVIPCLALGLVRQSDLLIGLSITVTCLLFGGYCWSKIALSRVKVAAEVPDSVTVGEQFVTTLDLQGPHSLEIGVSVFGSEPKGVRLPDRGSLATFAGSAMGRYDYIPVRLQTLVPDGLVASFRLRAIRLAQPFYVLPAPMKCEVDIAPPITGAFADPSGDMAGLRDYTPGDRIRDVHWPALARTSTLMVRDNRSTPNAGPVTVVLQATAGPELELVAGYARHAVAVLMGRGHQVTLGFGNHSVAVGDEIEAAKHLCEISPLSPPTSVSSGRALLISAERGATWMDLA